MITAGAFPTAPPSIDAVREWLPPLYNTADWGTQAWSRDVENAEATARQWIARTAEARKWPDAWRILADTLVSSARRGVAPTRAETILTQAGHWFIGFGLLALWRESVTGARVEQAEVFFRDLAAYWYVTATLGDGDAPEGWVDLGKVWAQARESTRLVARGQRMSDIGVMAYEATRTTVQDVNTKALPVFVGVTITVGAALLGRELAR